ncbi:MAG: N-acyl homoserine lactonase family protein [Acidimicrobiales bacterium]
MPAWLIRHPDGLVLFDCGMHTELAEPGPLLDTVSLFFGVGMGADQTVAAGLAARHVDPADIDVVVLSHLHFDHADGLAQIPDARGHPAHEWLAGVDDDLAAANTFRREDYDLGHDRQEIDGRHDLFGDGRVMCLPTPGHTPGHQSLRVRLDSGEVVLCADCAYFDATLEGGPLPPLGHDREQHAASLDQLRALGAAGARLIPGHDPAAFSQLASTLR